MPRTRFKFMAACAGFVLALGLGATLLAGRIQDARNYCKLRDAVGPRSRVLIEHRDDPSNTDSNQMADMGLVKIPTEEGMSLKSAKGVWQATSPRLSVTRVNPHWTIFPPELTLRARSELIADLNHSFLDCILMDRPHLRKLNFRIAYERAAGYSLDRIVTQGSRTIGIGRQIGDRTNVVVWIEVGEPPRHIALQLRSKDAILTDDQVIGWATQLIVSDTDNVETILFPEDLLSK